MLCTICTKEKETNAILTYSTADTFEKVRWSWIINAAFKTDLAHSVDTELDGDALGHAWTTSGSLEVAELANDVWGHLVEYRSN